MDRTNLDVIFHEQVAKVVIEGKNATGVECVSGFTINADKVVLSGGAYNTPKMLMLSGIGPAEHLAKVGIDVVKDVPAVGSNLADHMFGWRLWKHKEGNGMPDLVPQEHWGQAQLFGSFDATVDSHPPDYQITFIARDVPMKNFPGYTEEMKRSMKRNYGVAYNILRPKSRGQVRLVSSDPTEAPVIDHRYLTDPDDLDSYLKVWGVVEQIGKKLNEKYPSTQVIPEVGTDPAEFIKASLATMWHPTSTVAMGPAEEGCPVDPTNMRLNGYHCLYVADASVMPTITSANTHVPSMVIGARAAALIAADVVKVGAEELNISQ